MYLIAALLLVTVGVGAPDTSGSTSATTSTPAWAPFGLTGFDVLSLRAEGHFLHACVHDPGFSGGRGLVRRDLGRPGADWVHLGLDGRELSSVWVHPADPDIIVATVLEARSPRDALVFRTRDGGSSWERADHGLKPGRITAITGSTRDETASAPGSGGSAGEREPDPDRCDRRPRLRLGRGARRGRARDRGRGTAGLPGPEPIVLDLVPDPLREGCFHAALGITGCGVMRLDLSGGPARDHARAGSDPAPLLGRALEVE